MQAPLQSPLQAPPFPPQVRETSWAVVALAVLAAAAGSVLANAVLFQGRFRDGLVALHAASGGLVEPTLAGSLASLALLAVVVFGVGRLRPTDVGWSRAALGPALLVSGGFWLAMQGTIALLAARDGAPLALHAHWTQRGAGYVVGGLLAQLLGNALAEETAFQGFFLTQFFLKAQRASSRFVALAAALLGSQVLFALAHIPSRLFIRGLTGSELLPDLAGTFVLGLLFATAYLVTRNLFLTVGLHALYNAPAPLMQTPPGRENEVWYALVLILLVTWLFARALSTRDARGTE